MELLTKTFVCRHYSTPNLWYKVEIYFGSSLIEAWERQTMIEALDQIEIRGYART